LIGSGLAIVGARGATRPTHCLNIPDMTALKSQYGLELEPLDQFGPDELEKRHKLLFKLAGFIWS
jgi:hypothetical protein